MFSHYFVVIAVNVVTIAFKFLDTPEADRFFTAILMTAALVLFFISIFADSIYFLDRNADDSIGKFPYADPEI